ncbi:hypothetical protein HY522_00225 [bacterium]|nr:hypothetical protein [bacterium]
MEIKIVQNPISRSDLQHIATSQFGDMVKAVVDVSKRVMALGGEMHADEEAHLLDQGSRQEDLWGINLYPGSTDEDWIEFDSMINIRPSQKNRSRGVDDPERRRRIIEIARALVVG